MMSADWSLVRELARHAVCADVVVNDRGSIFVFNFLSRRAKAWRDEYLFGDAPMFGTDGVVVEPRYVEEIVFGAQEDGLEVAR